MLTRTPASVTANGRTYRLPNTPTVVICIDGSEPGYIEAAIEKGLCPNLDRIMKTGSNTTALVGHPELHQPEQPLDHHRPSAGRSRHRRQLLLRPRGQAGSDDERCALPARADDPGRVSEGRPQGCDGDGEGQAAHAARQGPRLQRRHRDRFLVGEGRQGDHGRERHRERARLRRHEAAGGLLGGSVGIRVRSRREAAEDVPAGRDVPLDHRLRAAQGGAGLRRLPTASTRCSTAMSANSMRWAACW